MTRNRSKYTKELLEPIVSGSHTMSAVMRSLGLIPNGGNFRMIRAILDYHDLDTDHFVGSAWARGQTRESNIAIARTASRKSIPDSEIFKTNSHPIHGEKLRQRLLRLGWEYICAECGISTWRERSLTLHVDHINGTHSDNRLENLRFLCPNCRQQTTTWGNKNARRAATEN